jgi:hypothetical protein
MHPKLSVIKIDFIQKEGNLSQESILFSSSSMLLLSCSNHLFHWNLVLKGTVNAFCLNDLRKMLLQWITTIWCAIFPIIPGINCRGLGVEISITFLEVISDLSWNPLLLMQINKINFCQFLNRNLLKACVLSQIQILKKQQTSTCLYEWYNCDINQFIGHETPNLITHCVDNIKFLPVWFTHFKLHVLL